LPWVRFSVILVGGIALVVGATVLEPTFGPSVKIAAMLGGTALFIGTAIQMRNEKEK